MRTSTGSPPAAQQNLGLPDPFPPPRPAGGIFEYETGFEEVKFTTQCIINTVKAHFSSEHLTKGYLYLERTPESRSPCSVTLTNCKSWTSRLKSHGKLVKKKRFSLHTVLMFKIPGSELRV